MIQEFDNQRRKNEKLDDIDMQAKEESEYLLKRANELRQEQEDEVKHLNEVNFPLFCYRKFLKLFFYLVNLEC